MRTLTEDIAWQDLTEMLSKRFAALKLKDPDTHATYVVADMKRAGWRIPLPPGTAPPKMGQPLNPDVVKRNIQRCRDELRKAKEGN